MLGAGDGFPCLVYSADDGEGSPLKGAIPLGQGARVSTCPKDHDAPTPFALAIDTSIGRRFWVSTDTIEAMLLWYWAATAACW